MFYWLNEQWANQYLSTILWSYLTVHLHLFFLLADIQYIVWGWKWMFKDYEFCSEHGRAGQLYSNFQLLGNSSVLEMWSPDQNLEDWRIFMDLQIHIWAFQLVNVMLHLLYINDVVPYLLRTEFLQVLGRCSILWNSRKSWSTDTLYFVLFVLFVVVVVSV